MNKKKKLSFGRRVIRLLDNLISSAMVLVFMIMLGFGGYSLWDSSQVFAAADASQYTAFKPSIDNSEEESLSFVELQRLNPEVFGWLNVYGTHIDYPIVQGEDNVKYVSTNAQGGYSMSGAIFLDYKTKKDFTDFNSIFYGHHMAESAMFGDIGKFVEKEYFEQRLYGNLYFDGKNHGIEFFAFIEADSYDRNVFSPPIENKKQQQQYLDNLLEKALYSRVLEDEITIDDRLVLLSTCTTSTTGRHLLVGRVVEQIFPIPVLFK